MAKDSDSTPPKRKVLDLIEPAKASSRRERQRTAAQPAPEAPAPPSALDAAKANALDIFDDTAKKKKPSVKKTSQSGKAVLPVISKLLEEEEPAPVVEIPAPLPASSVSPVVAEVAEASAEEEDNGNCISIKPPIIVSELAARMGLKPFVLLALNDEFTGANIHIVKEEGSWTNCDEWSIPTIHMRSKELCNFALVYNRMSGPSSSTIFKIDAA
jgi:hypothetical protein